MKKSWLKWISSVVVVCLVAESCLTLCDSTDSSSPSCPWDFTGKNTGVGCHFLLQGIFSTQGLNLGRFFTIWGIRESESALQMLWLSLKNKISMHWWSLSGRRQGHASHSHWNINSSCGCLYNIPFLIIAELLDPKEAAVWTEFEFQSLNIDNPEDAKLISGLGKSHMPWSN